MSLNVWSPILPRRKRWPSLIPIPNSRQADASKGCEAHERVFCHRALQRRRPKGKLKLQHDDETSPTSPSPMTGGQNGPVERSNKQLYVFERLKSCPAKAKTLAFPNPDTQLSATVDASKECVAHERVFCHRALQRRRPKGKL